MTLFHFITVALISASVSSQSSANIARSNCTDSFLNITFEYNQTMDHSEIEMKSILINATDIFVKHILSLSTCHLTTPNEYKSNIRLSSNNYADITISFCFCSNNNHILTTKQAIEKFENAVSEKTDLIPKITYISGNIIEKTKNNPDTTKQDNVVMIEIILLIIVGIITLLLLIGFVWRYFLKIRKRDKERTLSENHIKDIIAIPDKSHSEIPKQNNQLQFPNFSPKSKQVEISSNYNDKSDKNIRINQTDTLIIRLWLAEVGFPQYYDIFISNGYDSMDVIMAIEKRNDLQEIGITLKGHITKLLFEIRKLQNKQVEEGSDTTEIINVSAAVNNKKSMDRDVDTINVTVDEFEDEKKMNDAQSDCSDTDSNKYENGYQIRQTMSTGNDDYNQGTTISGVTAYPETKSKGSYDEKENYFGNEHVNHNKTKSGKAYPMNLVTNTNNGYENNNVTKNGQAYPMGMNTNKGSGFENGNVTKNGKAYPMNTNTNNGGYDNKNVTQNGHAYPIDTYTNKGSRYINESETKKGKAYPIDTYTSKGNDIAMPIGVGNDNITTGQ